MIACLSNARLEDRALVAQALFGAAQRTGQLGQVAAALVAQLDPLEGVPDALVRSELGGVARQLLQVQSRGGARPQEVFDGLAAMDRRPVPDDQQLAAHLAQQHPQEAHDVVGVIRPLLGLHEQAALWRDPADGREVVVGERRRQGRSLPTWRPGPHGPGQQVEAGLVYPDDGPTFFGGFFSRAGQRSRHHAVIAAWSRCAARTRGRWPLWRTACSSRLTWAGWDVTPKVRRMTSATRRQVQTWPRKPYASAPRSRRAGSWATCAALRLGLVPAAGWRRKASTPCLRPRLSHWLMAPGVTPSAAAMSCCFQPGCFSSQARR